MRALDVYGFVSMLRSLRVAGAVANPWADAVAGVDAGDWAPEQRCAQLRAFLAGRAGARLVLVGEAPGFRGARFTGVPMTSERLLAGQGAVILPIRRTSSPKACRTQIERVAGMAEPTATVVWRALAEAGLSGAAVAWNAFPLHPHRPGIPLSNRRPSAAELAATVAVLPQFLSLFPAARVVAVGGLARDRLAALGVAVTALRHPANGGAAEFRRGILQLAPCLGAA